MPIGRQVLVGKPQIAAGQRRFRVTIQQLTESEDASGFPLEEWTDLVTVNMGRTDARADERFAAQQQSAYVETYWHFPYRADMDPETVDVPKARRLVYRSRIFDILAATVIGSRDGIELLTLMKAA